MRRHRTVFCTSHPLIHAPARSHCRLRPHPQSVRRTQRHICPSRASAAGSFSRRPQVVYEGCASLPMSAPSRGEVGASADPHWLHRHRGRPAGVTQHAAQLAGDRSGTTVGHMRSAVVGSDQQWSVDGDICSRAN